MAWILPWNGHFLYGGGGGATICFPQSPSPYASESPWNDFGPKGPFVLYSVVYYYWMLEWGGKYFRNFQGIGKGVKKFPFHQRTRFSTDFSHFFPNPPTNLTEHLRWGQSPIFGTPLKLSIPSLTLQVSVPSTASALLYISFNLFRNKWLNSVFQR